MYNIYGDYDKLNIAAMYMDKTTCDQFLLWDSTIEGGRLVRDQDTFKKNFKTLKNPKYIARRIIFQQEGIMDEYFNNLLTLTTCVQDVTK